MLEPWQHADFAKLDAGWLKCLNGYGGGKLRFYGERPRGHSKTQDIAAQSAWALYASPVSINGVAAAGDRDQATLILEAIQRFAELNDWLSDRLEVQRTRVVNKQTGSWLKVISSDVASSYGHTPDFVLIDELTHWRRQSLWESLISSAAKKPNCMVCVIANAGLGMGVSWQWKLREICRQSDQWNFSRLDGPQASWITPDRLAEQVAMLSTTAYQRLWLNVWLREAGDALSEADVMGACSHSLELDAFDSQYDPFIAGLDLALSNHHASLVILGIHSATGTVRVCHVKNWKPSQFGGEIDLLAVKDYIGQMKLRYKLHMLCYDPYQAVAIAQWLEHEAHEQGTSLFTEAVAPGTENWREMATSLMNAFKNKLITMHAEPMLVSDLLKLSIVEKPTGYRIEAPEDPETGHCDRAMALALALPMALKFAKELHRQPVMTAPERREELATSGLRPGERW